VAALTVAVITSSKVPLSMRFFRSLSLFGSVSLFAMGACTDQPTSKGVCQTSSALSCNTVLAGNADAGVSTGMVGYSCTEGARPDENAKYIDGIPFGQICAAQSTTGDYCCTPESDLANCAYNPVAICPEGYGYQCWGANRPEVNNPGVTCGNGVREGQYINYCCQAAPRPVGCTQAKGAYDCTGGLIGWVCPDGFRPRGEDFGANESRANYYYFVCGVPTPAPNPIYKTYCCFSPSPVLPGGSCVYSPAAAKTIPNCTAGRFAFACYGRDTPEQDYSPRIKCTESPIDGVSDEGYPAHMYCCDYVPAGSGSGTGSGLDGDT
jgi:hypothetical protein